MILVEGPLQHQSEAKYVLDVVLGEFLGLDFAYQPQARTSFRITMTNRPGELLLGADFFVQESRDWLAPESLPDEVPEHWRPSSDQIEAGLLSDEVPVLYGAVGAKCTEDGWHLNPDLLGSAFFLLSGYEERVIRERDAHGRFPGRLSLPARAGFIDRPIVDEYTEILWFCLHSLWPELVRKVTMPDFELTCDVDQPFDCTAETFRDLLRSGAGDIVKRAAPLEALRRIRRFLYNRSGDFRYDPYYVFDWYLDQCEQFGLRALFYFIADSRQPMNGCYRLEDSRIRRLLTSISKRGHEIGLHASYQSYCSAETIEAERLRLQAVIEELAIDREILHNRQHYLRWDAAATPDSLERAGIRYDSTGGYADIAGFRYGTSREFPMWGWSQNKPLQLIQQPLIVMEATVMDSGYMGLGTGEAAAACIAGLQRQTSHYRSPFRVLWHNSSLRNQAEVGLFQNALQGAAGGQPTRSES